MPMRKLLVLLGIVTLLCVVMPAVRADTPGTASGTVAAVTDKYIDLKGDRQTVRFSISKDTAVYSWDGKTQKPLSAIKPGGYVRVLFEKAVIGSAYRKATEIDIIQSSSPLPIPTGS